jgi:hypothetical protein
MKLVLVIILSMLFITAQRSGAELQSGRIMCSVSNAEGEPIPNATVYLTNDTIKTFGEANEAGLALIGPDVEKLFGFWHSIGIAIVSVAQPTAIKAYGVLDNVPPGKYAVNARALDEEGKILYGSVPDVVVDPGATTTVDLVLNTIVQLGIKGVTGDLDKVEVVNTQCGTDYFRDSWTGYNIKRAYVSGTITNKINSLLDGWIKCNFYDANGTYLGHTKKYFALGAGMSYSFKLPFEDKYAEYAESASVEVFAEKTHINGDTKKAEIIVFDLREVDVYGMRMYKKVAVNGTARNIADTMQNVTIKAKLCDSSGKSLSAENSTESKIPAGYTWQFDMRLENIEWDDIPYGAHVYFEIKSRDVEEQP